MLQMDKWHHFPIKIRELWVFYVCSVKSINQADGQVEEETKRKAAYMGGGAYAIFGRVGKQVRVHEGGLFVQEMQRPCE